MLGGYATQTPTPNKRQKTNGQYGGGNLRMCPHCGRTFKRTEHLERHVRTHTKEKPFLCHCGAAFARRDLLTRHYRVADHGDESQASPGSAPEAEPASNRHPGPTSQPPMTQRHHSGHGGAADADLAAAVSLSGMSVDPWAGQQQPMQQSMPQAMQPPPLDHHQGNGFVDTRQYNAGLLTPQFFDGEGIDFDPHFREFANFLDGVGLPAEWSPYFNGPEKDGDAIDPELKDDQHETNSPRSGQRTRAGTPFSSWLPSAPTGNKISNISDNDYPRAMDPETRPFKVTEEQRMKLHAVLEKLSDIIDPSFRLPSRHALTRYITSFFEGFHSHMPFIHAPTWHILDHSLELIFGIAAIGAQYCFEQRVSERLFFAGKAVLMERLSREADNFGPRTSSFIAMNSPATRSSASMSNGEQWDPIETVRALITLMGFASWESKAYMVQEAFALQGLLTHVLRDIGLDDVESQPPTPANGRNNGVSLDTQWRVWVDHESSRRSKLIAFSFLHTHSIAYNVYPVLRSNEVNLRLPCSTKEWKAPNPVQWQIARNEVPDQQLYFQQALSILLKNKDPSTPLTPIPTPLGNYVLLHGLLQRIHIVRDLSLPVMSNTAALPAEEVEKLERGLRSWTSGWQQAPESSLDPNNENGPIPFTSSSLLALAYVRIYLHLGPYRQLESRDPNRIAKAIARSPDIERSDGVIAALLYTAHMISIPVRLGVDRVARSQAFFWSVRHSLSSLDCSILLSKWLAKLGDTMGQHPLSDSEDRILHWVRSIVEEAYTVVDFDEDNEGSIDFRDPGSLSFAVLKIWAHFFKSNTQWPFINIIGESLEKYRGIMIQRRMKGAQ